MLHSDRFRGNGHKMCIFLFSKTGKLKTNMVRVPYIEDITRWREDMNFMFEWQEQYLTSERSERVRYCSCHENIKFISSSQRVMFFLLYGDKNIQQKQKAGIVTLLNDTTLTKVTYGKYATRVPDEVAYGIYE